MGPVATKPVLWISDKVRFKPTCSTTEASLKIEILLVAGLAYIASFQKGNNKGTDQTARMRRLVCAFVVRKPPKQVFTC